VLASRPPIEPFDISTAAVPSTQEGAPKRAVSVFAGRRELVSFTPAVAAVLAVGLSGVIGFQTMKHWHKVAAVVRSAPPLPAPRRLAPVGEPGATNTSAAIAQTDDHTTSVLGSVMPNQSVFSPAFASSGSAIFFHTSRAGDGSSALAMARTSGGGVQVQTILDDGAKNYHVRPSPDGRLIAFDSDREEPRGVYVANSDGSGARRISGPGYAAAPTWSPDGTRIAYVRAEPGRPRVWNLWVLPVGGDSTAATRITHYPYGQTWSASWFPDNHRVAYTHEDKLYVLDLATGRSREFASPLPGKLLRTPAVSPDGMKIVFQVYRHGAWLMDVADGSMRQLMTDPSAEEFAWSADGHQLAFHSRRHGAWGIYVQSGN
jgi:Tol biopolymer transport system component